MNATETTRYQVAAACGSNPDAMRLTVSDDAAVDALSVVFPALAKSGGYDGALRSDDYDRSDLLDVDAGRSGDESWDAIVWSERSKNESLVVYISVSRELIPSSSPPRLARMLHTRVIAKMMAPFAGTRTYSREMRGRTWATARPNIRREVAKAVALFLNDVTIPEAPA